MYFSKRGNTLIGKLNGELIQIEAWSKDSLRIRATRYSELNTCDWGLTEKIVQSKAIITIKDDGSAEIVNGKIKAIVSNTGVLSFYKDGKKILSEYHRSYDPSVTKESNALKILPREYSAIMGGDYSLSVKFNSNDDEKIFGMGQYQQSYLDLKGCVLELAQRNSQISIPFALSSLGYGFMWNNPAVGKVTFGKNYTEWKADCTEQMDYWITVADLPSEIVKNYTGVTGRVTVMKEDLLGLWQCKLRYRTQEEVLTVARKYKELGIHLDVIVIDFFHWVRQGDWGFDKKYWPDPKAMCDELHAMGTKVMVSVWPSVDRKSVHFNEMKSKGLLVNTEHGTMETYDFMGDCVTFDATNPEARKYIWNVCKKNYVKYGIDLFWLDNAEPDYAVYDFANYRYYLGPAMKVSNIYPMLYGKAFFDGMKTSGKDFVNLERCAWFGSQKLNTVIWNGDVQSTWECLEDSVQQGLNMGIAGIPWWTTDIGGFMNGNVKNPAFIELLERWFEFAVFTPILRMHGDREPNDYNPICDDPQQDYGGGFLYTGQPNEFWSYTPEAQRIFEKNLKLRLSLKPYVSKLMKEASKTGSPLMRTMFYEFPEDENCWKLKTQYMFGPEYLVAPILHGGELNRDVYLPKGSWKNINDGKVFSGEKWINVRVSIDSIPVFMRISK